MADMTEQEIKQAAVEDWLKVLEELWTAVGKPIDPARLHVYHRALAMIPMGLLELAVKRVIRENHYQVVPLPGAVWEAVEAELGHPNDTFLAIEAWCEAQFSSIERRQ